MKRSGVIIVFVTAVLVIAPRAVSAALEDGALAKGSGPRVYTIENGERRWIQSEKDFVGLRYQWNRIRLLSDNELLKYPRGEILTVSSGYPDYTLLKGSTPKVYIILNRQRRWITQYSTIAASRLSIQNLLLLSDRELSAIPEGEPITIPIPRDPETTITIAPEEGSIVERNDIIFGFRGYDGAGSTDVTFETKIEGFDTSWVSTGKSVERLVRLPLLPFPYVFFVRAKDENGLMDRTPAYRQFQIGRSRSAGLVKIDSVSAGSEIPSSEYVILSVQGNQSVDLTGWKIGNDRGAFYSIPNVIDDYSITNTFIQRLVVPPNGRVVVGSGRSPVGSNIRLNACSGFLERLGAFTPPMIQICPAPSQAIIRNLSYPCQQYLSGLQSCHPPKTLSNDEQRRVGRECVEFASAHWNYNGCRNDHRLEPTYFEKEWRVFLNLNEHFWRDDHDTITLRDTNDKVVDQYRY